MDDDQAALEHVSKVQMCLREAGYYKAVVVVPSPESRANGATSKYHGLDRSEATQRDTRKAGYLIRMRQHGPEWPVTCASHGLWNKHDLWKQCSKIRVVDALLHPDMVCDVAKAESDG